MIYKKNSSLSTFGLKYIEYKNGYFLGLIGVDVIIRIFIVKTLIFHYEKNSIASSNELSYNQIKFYFSDSLCKNFKFKIKKFIQYTKFVLENKFVTILRKFKGILWFKSNAFKINIANRLFINNGRIWRPRFQIPKSFIFNLSRKKKMLRLRTYDSGFLQFYIHLLESTRRPNNFTGKGIRIKNKIIKKKLGKRKIF